MSEKGLKPKSIGVIVDGNRRWAKERGMPTLLGHKAGYEKLTDFFAWSVEAGVEVVYAYCFSTENWGRAPEEVSYLMELMRDILLGDLLEKSLARGYKLVIAGQKTRFSPELQKLIADAEAKTAHCTNLTVVLCLSYGGRQEIVDAVNSYASEGGTFPMAEDALVKYLWTGSYADPDMIIRTSGEQRLSNFLTWKSVYSELFFPQVHWPAFTQELFKELLEEYASRHRRFGK